MSTMLEDLKEVVRCQNESSGFVRRNTYLFIKNHHATIQKNAEDAKRLRALERALEEMRSVSNNPKSVDYINGWFAAREQMRKRANEILREGQTP